MIHLIIILKSRDRSKAEMNFRAERPTPFGEEGLEAKLSEWFNISETFIRKMIHVQVKNDIRVVVSSRVNWVGIALRLRQ